MKILQSVYVGPGIIHTFEQLPNDAKAALRNLKVGETATVLGPDNREYQLTLVERREISEEDFERLVA
jgi:hypothetical protein